MNSVYPGETREILEVFCLYEGEGEYFCLAQEPIEREQFSFGGEKTTQKGFFRGYAIKKSHFSFWLYHTQDESAFLSLLGAAF